MKILKHMVNLVIIPLATLLFFFFGMTAAALSGLIEYSVIRGLFESENLQLLPPAGFAVALVTAFEATKIYLHFLKPKMKDSFGEAKGLLRTISLLLPVLVAVSMLCSIIFTIATLDHATYNEQENQQAIADINAQLEQDIAQAEEKYQNIYKNQMNIYSEALKAAQEAVNNFKITKDEAGPLLAESLGNVLNANANQAYMNYTEADKRYAAERDKNIRTETTDLRTAAQEKINALQQLSENETGNQFDNPILSSFLRVIAKVVFGADSYPRWVYLCFSTILGLAIAGILEVIISITAHLLAIPLDFLTEDSSEISQKLRQWCNELVLTIFKTFCAVFICILILAFYGTEITKEQVLSNILACMLAIYLVKKCLKIPPLENLSATEYLLYQIRDCAVQGIVSLMGYVLLGFLLGNDALTLDLNTAAIGIGTAVSGGIGRLPGLLEHFTQDNKTHS